MTLDIVNPPALPDPSPNGYSTAVIVPADTRMAYISGQGGFGPDGSLPQDFAAHVEQTYANLLAAIDGIGGRPDHVVKLTVYVVDHAVDKLGILTAAVKRAFGDRLPAQTLVPVPGLAVPGMQFEVDAVVALP